MSPIEIAKALLAGITRDQFVREIPGGWLYEAEVNPPMPSTGVGLGYDIKLSLCSPNGVETEVYVCKPRPLAPVETMFIKAGKSPGTPMEAFPQWLVDVLKSAAKDACEASLVEAVAAA